MTTCIIIPYDNRSAESLSLPHNRVVYPRPPLVHARSPRARGRGSARGTRGGRGARRGCCSRTGTARCPRTGARTWAAARAPGSVPTPRRTSVGEACR